MKIGVYYKILDSKIFNGSMFYAFEHFVFLNKFCDVYFILYFPMNVSPEYFALIKDAFENRYNLDKTIWHNVKIVRSIKDLYRIKVNKAVFFDYRSLESLFYFISPKEIFVYQNEDKPKLESSDKKIIYYGYYDYQQHDKKQLLQINFDIFKDIKTSNKKAFVSSGIKIDRDIIENYVKKPYFVKEVDFVEKNLFEKFDELYYFHTIFDRNNRILIESAYYDKNINLIEINSPNDSIKERFQDAKNKNIDKYYLTENNIMIQDILKENYVF